MQIWVDADACPVVIREILYRASKRNKTLITFVANQYINIPKSPLLKMLQVEPGFDVADNMIVKKVTKGDLVITSDIPLADEIIEKHGFVLTPRGENLTKENIKVRLNIRDFMETMRSSGVHTGGPAALSHSDRQKFANCLDRFLAQNT